MRVPFLIWFLFLYMLVVMITLLSHIITSRYFENFESGVDKAFNYWSKNWNRAKLNSSGIIKKKVFKRLRRPHYLVGFYNFVKSLSVKERMDFLISNEQALISKIRKSNKTHQTYFAFMIGDFTYTDNFLNYHYDELMIDFVKDNSVHLRENALKALYHFGHAQTIRDAFLALSDKMMTHSEKLLSDGLTGCEGDKEKIAEVLMSGYDKYLNCYKMAVVNFLMRTGNHKYDARFKRIIDRNNASIDIQCAILRLIGRNVSDENGTYIADYMNKHDVEIYWEAMSVAAGVLGNFKRNDYIMNTLKKGLTSSKWHVRMNSAKSISRIGIFDEEIKEIMNGDDQFAKDALSYALSTM